jgi:predicted nucleotidyltransferase
LLFILQSQSNLEFVVLVGSRTLDNAREDSDWDIALQWSQQVDWLTLLGNVATLRLRLAAALKVE